MSGEDAVHALIQAFERLNIPYMVVGSLSVNVYAVPRSSQDADVVVQLTQQSLSDLMEALPDNFRLDGQTRLETVTLTTRVELHIDEIPFRIELFDLSEDAHDQKRFERRIQTDLGDMKVWVPTVEDVLIMKLRWCMTGGRHKDEDDVRNLLAFQHENIDWAYVNHWLGEHGTGSKLEVIRDSMPPLN